MGGARATTGSGLSGLTDRVAAVDGTLVIDSEPGEGTHLRAVIPLAGELTQARDGGTSTSASPNGAGVHPGSSERNDAGSASTIADQHLADDPAPDRAEPQPVVERVRLLEHVEPQRRLRRPAVLGETDLLGLERRVADSRRATASPDGSPTARPRWRSRLASDA